MLVCADVDCLGRSDTPLSGQRGVGGKAKRRCAFMSRIPMAERNWGTEALRGTDTGSG